MAYPVKIDKEKTVCAQTTARISPKKGVALARYLIKRTRKFVQVKRFLEDLVAGKVSVNGKLYTKTARALLDVLKSVEANAKFRGFDANHLRIISFSVNKGPSIYRRRRKNSFGSKLKAAHIKIVVEKK